MGNVFQSCQALVADSGGNPTSAKRTDGQAKVKSKLHVRISKTTYTDDDERVIRRFLPEFVASKPATLKDLSLIQDHWQRLCQFTQVMYSASTTTTTTTTTTTSTTSSSDDQRLSSDKVFDRFYRFLFELSPDLKPLFRNSMHIQGRALRNIVEGVLRILGREDAEAQVTRLAASHEKIGVRCDAFNPVGIALMLTLETLAPGLWTKDVEHAWRTVYCHVALLVLTKLHQIISRRAPTEKAINLSTVASTHPMTRRQTKPKNNEPSSPHGPRADSIRVARVVDRMDMAGPTKATPAAKRGTSPHANCPLQP